MEKIKNLEEFRQGVQKDMERYTNAIAKQMAKDIAEEMTNVAHNAIKTFYEQYDPEDLTSHHGKISYYRNWNFWKSYKRYYKNRHPFYAGGIILNMNDFPDDYRGTNSSPTNVFWRVYSGYHGIASFQSAKHSISAYVPIMRPSPIKLIRDRFEYILNHLGDYDKAASKKVRKKDYKYIFK